VKIGMRMIKTGIAVSLSLILANLFGLESPFFAGVAAVITMQITVAESFLIAWNRMLGTIIGATLGMVASLLGLENPVVIGFVIIIIIFILDRFHWNLSISIATIVFLSIIFGAGEENPLSYSLNRILDTFVGITTGVLVNYFVFPPRLSEKIYGYSFSLIQEVVKVIDEMLCKNEEVDIERIQKKINILKRDYAIFKGELKLNFKQEQEEFNGENTIFQFEKMYRHLEVLSNMEGCHVINNINKQRLSKFLEVSSYQEKVLVEEEQIVYNYHLGQILEILIEQGRLYDARCVD
jgi:uncharacterized membrane protein YgaE (UPF0421/DUF939 family)